MKQVKSKCLNIFFFTILLVILFVSGCDNYNDKLENISDIAFIHVGNTDLYIPKKYLKGKGMGGKNYKGELVSLGMWALLPNFDWYDENINKYEFQEVRGWGQRIYIDLDFRKKMLLTDFIKKHPRFIKDKTLQKHNYIKIIYGLELYQHYWHKDDVLYNINKDGDIDFRLICSKDGSVPAPGCRGFWDFNEDVRVNVSFHKKYLPIWKKIKNTINELLYVKT